MDWLILSCSRKEAKLYLHKLCKSLPVQETLNVNNVTGWADNNRLYGRWCSHGSIWDVFTKTAGIQHCSQETMSIHLFKRACAHYWGSLVESRPLSCFNFYLEIARLVCFLWASSRKTPKLWCRNSLIKWKSKCFDLFQKRNSAFGRCN